MATLKISNPQVVGKLKLPAESASKALQVNASGELESSTVTLTELGYLSGVTSAVQTQLGTKALASDLTTHTGNTSNPHSVTKAQVGLGSVDNTADADKPVSTATQTALNLKADLASPTFTGTVSGISKSMVGLGNVDNTSDVNKPVSTAQATAIGLKLDASQKGAASGVATLDSNSLVPITQIPPAALERLVIVANQAARFALTIATIQNGDTVKETDTGLMYFVKDDTNLGNAAGYEAYTAGGASSVPWSGITGIPTPVSSLSGTNTGDQDLSGYVLNTRTVNGHALSADVTVTKTDVGLANVTNVAQLPASYLDIDGTLASNSDIKVPSQKAVKTYVADQLAAYARAGDIAHTTYTGANNVTIATAISGLAFNAATVRSFRAHVSVAIDATTPLNEVFELTGVQIASGFVMSQSSVGDDSGIVLTITPAGDIKYTSQNSAGWVSTKINFRAQVTDV